MQAFLRLLHKDVDTPAHRDSVDNSPRDLPKSRSGMEPEIQKSSLFATSETKSAIQRRPVFNPDELKMIRSKLEGTDLTQQKLMKIIKSERRTDYEAKTLYEHIQDFTFFQTFNERNQGNYFETEAFIRLCKNLKYERALPGRVIFKEGEKANGKLYIVYSGEVSVISKHESFFQKQNRETMNDEEKSEFPGSKKMSPRNSIYFPTQNPEEDEEIDGFDEDLEGIDMNYIKLMKTKSSITRFESSLVPSRFSSEIMKKSQEPSSPLNRKSHDPQSPSNKKNQEPSSPTNKKSDFSTAVLTRRRSKVFKLRQRKGSNESRSSDRSSMSDPGSRRASLLKEGGYFVQKFLRDDRKKMTAIQTINNNPASGSGRPSLKIDLGLVNTIHERRDSFSLEKHTSKYGVVKDTIVKGGFFGEKALFDKAPRNATIMVNTLTELLVVNKNDFLFVSENYDKKKKRLLEFMKKVFPELEYINSRSLEELIYRLEEKRFTINDFICKEGEKSDKFYVLCSGQCQFTKTIMIDESKAISNNKEKFKDHIRKSQKHKQTLPVCWIEPGVFIGEEILINGTGLFHYNVKVISTDAVIYAIEKPKFFFTFPKQVIEQVKTSCAVKAKQNYELLKDVLTVRFSGHRIQEDTGEFNSGSITLVPNVHEKSRIHPIKPISSNTASNKINPKLERIVETEPDSIQNSTFYSPREISKTPKVKPEALSDEKKLQIRQLSRKPYVPFSSEFPGTLNNPSNRTNSQFFAVSPRDSSNLSLLNSTSKHFMSERTISPDKSNKKVAEVIRSKDEKEGMIAWEEYYTKIEDRLQENASRTDGPKDFLNLESIMGGKESERLLKIKKIKAGLHLPSIPKFQLSGDDSKGMPILDTLKKKVMKKLNSTKKDDSIIIASSRINFYGMESPSHQTNGRLTTDYLDESITPSLNTLISDKFNLPGDYRIESSPLKIPISHPISNIKALDGLQIDRESSNLKIRDMMTDVSMRFRLESDRDDISIAVKSAKNADRSNKDDDSSNKTQYQNVSASSLLKRKAEVNQRLKYKSLKPVVRDLNNHLSSKTELKIDTDPNRSPRLDMPEKTFTTTSKKIFRKVLSP